MTTIKHVLDQKGHDVRSIHPDASVFDAIKIMAENNIGSLVVLENGRLVGLIAERHYAREIVLRGRDAASEADERVRQEMLDLEQQWQQIAESSLSAAIGREAGEGLSPE